MLKRFTYIKKIIFSYKAWRKDKIYEGKTRTVLVNFGFSTNLIF